MRETDSIRQTRLANESAAAMHLPRRLLHHLFFDEYHGRSRQQKIYDGPVSGRIFWDIYQAVLHAGDSPFNAPLMQHPDFPTERKTKSLKAYASHPLLDLHERESCVPALRRIFEHAGVNPPTAIDAAGVYTLELNPGMISLSSVERHAGIYTAHQGVLTAQARIPAELIGRLPDDVTADLERFTERVPLALGR